MSTYRRFVICVLISSIVLMYTSCTRKTDEVLHKIIGDDFYIGMPLKKLREGRNVSYDYSIRAYIVRSDFTEEFREVIAYARFGRIYEIALSSRGEYPIQSAENLYDTIASLLGPPKSTKEISPGILYQTAREYIWHKGFVRYRLRIFIRQVSENAEVDPAANVFFTVAVKRKVVPW